MNRIIQTILTNTLLTSIAFYLIGLSTYELKRYSNLYENTTFTYKVIILSIGILIGFGIIIFLLKEQEKYLKLNYKLLNTGNVQLQKIKHSTYSLLLGLSSIAYFLLYILNINLAFYISSNNDHQIMGLLNINPFLQSNLISLLIIFIIILFTSLFRQLAIYTYAFYDLIFYYSFIRYWIYYINDISINYIDFSSSNNKLFWFPILLVLILLIGNIIGTITRRFWSMECISDWECYKLNSNDILLIYKISSLLPIYICFQWGILRL